MLVKLISTSNNWIEVKNAALNTINKETNIEPTSEWKRKILLSEHSPIRLFKIHWKWIDLLSWVSVHIVRHKYGIEHWVRSQRTDRTGIDRNELKQSELINHECEANIQALINISRKRLCNQASKETRIAWKAFLTKLAQIEPEIDSVCVRECVYRGWCYEYNSCGFHKTEKFQKELNDYRKNINDWNAKSND